VDFHDVDGLNDTYGVYTLELCSSLALSPNL